MLPSAHLPVSGRPGGVQVDTRYRSATGRRVGGDWVDALPAPDGSLTLVIGDVCGHDAAAAATMGRLRARLRGLVADLRESPAALTCRLDDALAAVAPNLTATTVLARLDAPDADGARILHWSNAGHHPPLLLDPDGAVRVLDTEAELMLGVQAAPRSDHHTVLQPGSTLLLYTDGLIERRDEDLSCSQGHLLDAVKAWGHRTVPDLLDSLVDRCQRGWALQDSDCGHDDVAILAARVAGSVAPTRRSSPVVRSTRGPGRGPRRPR